MGPWSHNRSKSVLLSAAQMLGRPCGLMDVGASGGIDRRWEKVKPFLQIIGLEPNPDELRKLEETKTENVRWLPFALSDTEGDYPLYVTRAPTNTSMLLPNPKALEWLHYDLSGFDIIDKMIVPCATLDGLIDRYGLQLDAIKLDTQGTELHILRGGTTAIAQQVFSVQTEVEFIEMYQGQPMFCDVHQYLVGHGFELIDVGDARYIKPKDTTGVGGHKGVLLSADALYFRRVDRLLDRSVERNLLEQLGAAIVICLAYGYPDYALAAVRAFSGSGLLDSDRGTTLVEGLQSIQHWSKRIPVFPGRETLAKIFRELHAVFHVTTNAEVLNFIGNRTASMLPDMAEDGKSR